jgi:hypothetical protein
MLSLTQFLHRQPLLVGSGVVFVAAVLNTFYLIEPKDVMASREREREELGMDDELADEDDDQVQTVEKLDYKVFSLIILGALGDNIGSSGLMPLCLSPLAFETFYKNVEPAIMSQVACKWISVLVALMVVPGTLVSLFIYNKLGLAGGCILGNVITGEKRQPFYRCPPGQRYRRYRCREMPLLLV